MEETARETGIPNLFIAAVLSFDICDVTAKYGVDAGIEFPPHQTDQVRITGLQPIGDDALAGGAVYDYAEIARRFGKRTSKNGLVFKGVMPSWDNTARRGDQSTVFHGSTPAIYASWLKDACEVTKLNPEEERLLFVNAWNEWGEGAHLESDARYGFAYLNATANVLRNYYHNEDVDEFIAANNLRFERKNDVAVILHCYHEDLLPEIVARYLTPYAESVDVFATLRPDVSFRSIECLNKSLGNVMLLREENRGRDVRPFLLALSRVVALGYPLACKLHTKQSPQLQAGHRWRESLISSILGGGKAVALAKELFTRHPHLGLLGLPGVDDLTLKRSIRGIKFGLTSCLPS